MGGCESVSSYTLDDLSVHISDDGMLSVRLRDDGSILATAVFRGATWDVQVLVTGDRFSEVWGANVSIARMGRILSRRVLSLLNDAGATFLPASDWHDEWQAAGGAPGLLRLAAAVFVGGLAAGAVLMALEAAIK